MPQKVIRRTIKVRHSARPSRAKKSAPAGGLFGMLAQLSDASNRLERSRPRRWW